MNTQPQLDINLEETASVELVTPEIAAKWLERNPDNRPLRDESINLYKREIEKGRWYVNNNGIGFCENGDLMDGQHRLNAIVKSNTAQRMVVVKNLKRAAFTTIDTGRKRTVQDMLAINNVPYYLRVSGAAKMIHSLRSGNEERPQGAFKGGIKYTIDDILELINSDKDIISNTSYVLNNFHKLTKICVGPTLSCALFHLFTKRDAKLALEMFKLLDSGAIGDPESVLLYCRNLLIEHKQAAKLNRSSDVGYSASLMVRTWNFMRDGIYDQRFVQDYSLPIPIIK